MKITLKHYDQEITIENEHDDLSIDNIMQDLIRPLLLAAGFQPKSIAEYFEE